MGKITNKLHSLIAFGLISILTVGLATSNQQAVAATFGSYQFVSVNNSGDGQGGNNHSNGPIISANGQVVGFISTASNLVAGDTNNVRDVFVRNLKTNITSLVSTSSAGVQSNAASSITAISETGRYVVYQTSATNLEAGPSYPYVATYLHDMSTGTNTLITHAGWNNSYTTVKAISNDGRFVTATATPDANGGRVYVYEVATTTWIRVAQPIDSIEQQQGQGGAMASCDNTFIVFVSGATNLTSSADTNGTTRDIFLVDIRDNFKITNITSHANSHSTNPHISCNGNYVEFESMADNVVSTPALPAATYDTHLYRYDRVNGTLSMANVRVDGTVYDDPTYLAITDSGKVLFRAYASSSSYTMHYVFRDHDNNANDLISGTSPGNSSLPSFSADGRKFSVGSSLTNLVSGDANNKDDVFVAEVN